MTAQMFKVVALLVLNGRCMNRDTLVERLWPDCQVDSGRHQLRTLLSRLRRTARLEIVRQGELVVLRDEVWCDLEEFIRAATRAVAGNEGRDGLLRHGLPAQELWVGAPLEAWRYESWALQVRAKAFSLQDRMWTLLQAAEGGRQGDTALTRR